MYQYWEGKIFYCHFTPLAQGPLYPTIISCWPSGVNLQIEKFFIISSSIQMTNNFFNLKIVYLNLKINENFEIVGKKFALWIISMSGKRRKSPG